MNMRFILFLSFMAMNSFGISQADILFNATFNGCDAFDEVSAFSGDIHGNPVCVCAVEGDGYRFDGLNDSIGYDSGIEDLLNQDFAISFYFFLDNTGINDQEVDLVAYGDNECFRDSSLTIRYVPQTNSIRTEISINSSIIFNLVGEIPAGSCWNYLVLNKNDDRLELYINEVLVADDADFDRNFQFKPNGVLSIGSSPCITTFSSRFKGLIDEFKIYNRPLLENEVISENLKPDKIITEDETIFVGESVIIETGNTCTESFKWTPIDDLVDEDTKSPIASPDETSQYVYTVNYGTCISTDSIRISVVNPGESQCDQLLLPNAFTPNNDRRNDLFGISNDFIIDNLKSFEIFSKWGEKVFEASSLDDKWDGNFKGQQMHPTTLLYRVVYDCNGEEFCATGSFLLVR